MADSDATLNPKVDLAEEADWSTAVSKVLANQSAYNNVISEVLKGITRIVGWLLLTLALYGNVFTDIKRRKREAPDEALKEESIIHFLNSINKYEQLESH